ncbi:MAG TPA: HEAT repeat domain-containing protein [Gemmataceae bacterium]|nr:HEAT repeat domain-containing protein [Gemmataceae bacterium]
MRIRRAKLVLVLLLTFLPATAGCRNPRQVEYSVPSLVKTLKEDKDPNMRYWAAETLGRFGPEAQSAVPDLVTALKDEHKMVRMGAAYALGEIGSADAVRPLQEATKDQEKEVRDAAATALKQIQQKGKKR